MLSTEYVLKTAHQLRPALTCPDVLALCDALIAKCGEEIALTTAKAGGRADRYKAALRFAKECTRNTSRPALSGAVTLPDGWQYICDGYRMVLYDVALDGLPQAKLDGVAPMDAQALMSKPRLYNERLDVPSAAELRARLKIAKAKQPGVKQFYAALRCRGEIMVLSAEYLLSMREIIGDDAAIYGEHIHSPIYARADGCEMLVLPMRVSAPVEYI